MTRKDFEAFARIVQGLKSTDTMREINPNLAQDRDMIAFHIAGQLADVLEKLNPRFDRAKFLAACGV